MREMARLVLAGGLIAALAGCGGGSSSTDSATASAPDAAAASAPDTGAAPAAAGTPAATVAAGSPPAEFAICQACHSTQAGTNGVGPSLAGVFGRKAGTAPGYDYSDAVKNLGVTWDESSLDKWLSGPMTMAPGTKMTFPGYPEAEKRKAVIDYLKTLK